MEQRRRQVIRVEEGARAVIDGLPRNGRVVGVHHAVHQTDEHPLRHQRRLRLDHSVTALHDAGATVTVEVGALKERQVAVPLPRFRSFGQVRVVPGDRVVGERAHDVALAGRQFEGSYPQVARGDPGEHRTRFDAVAVDRAAGGDH